jgi:aminopeptidase N
MHGQLAELLTEAENRKLTDGLSVYGSRREFEAIQSTRAALMLYGLQNVMDTAVFNEFLKAYVERFTYKFATVEDFIVLAEMFYEDSLTEFFNEWLNGEELPSLVF